MKEVWRHVTGYAGRYEVSNLGRVRSVGGTSTFTTVQGVVVTRRFGPRMRALALSNSGYHTIQLEKRGKRHLVHRLVAEAFVPGDTGLQVNHIDGNRLNNCSANLEWVSQSDNMKHCYQVLGNQPHKRTPVIVGGTHYASMTEAANVLGVHAGSILSALKHGHKCCGHEVQNVLSR